MKRKTMETPFGAIRITSERGAVTEAVFWSGENFEDREELLDAAEKELKEFFCGRRKNFTFPIEPTGTAFQREVWTALCAIPYGETRSYGEIARQIGRPKACRAVGMACNRNPILVVIPCHRVVGGDGSLTGYAGGLDVKRALLELERE